jgi:radical SAM superfamily enzyme YgiQ (UPF0313 family)
MEKIDKTPVRVKLVFSRTLNSQSAASVSMGSLAAYLRSLEFNADLCLFDAARPDDAEKRVAGIAAQNIIIAKPNFKDFQTMFPFLARLRKAGQIGRVFLCGPFAQRNAESIMSGCVWCDGVILDQMEASAGSLLAALNKDLSVRAQETRGCLLRDPQTGMIAPRLPSAGAVPLSALPFPARDIEVMEDVGYVNMEASRGCRFGCSFCHVPLVAEMSAAGAARNIRHSASVVDEIERLNKDLGKTLFIFNDSCFWSTREDDKRILAMCDEIMRRGLDVRFYIYLKGEPFIGDKVLRALVKAGLVRVFLGIENSVPSSLAVYRKKIPADLYAKVRAKLDPLGVNIHIGYITIEPYSSLDDVLSNLSYLLRIGKLFRLGVITEPVRVVPGTSLHSSLIRDGLIDPALSYDNVTYGYRFAHDEVGRLLHAWKTMFDGHLEGTASGFEYHLTTGELLRTLATRLDAKFADIFKEPFAVLNAKKIQGMEMLFGYLASTIECARVGEVRHAGDPGRNRGFIEGFKTVAGEIEALHASIVSVVRERGGGRAVRELYPRPSKKF